ncbi:DUF6527 family protein [Candidatus Accumulibacter phosphatis]
MEVVTPLSPAKWQLSDHWATVSLHPSIGNWSFPCRSHYWISHGKIRWAGAMSDQQIKRVRANDHRAIEFEAQMDRPSEEKVPPVSWGKRFIAWLRRP